MSEFNKYSTDGGATFIDVEDSNAVHYGDQSKGYVGKNLVYKTLFGYNVYGNANGSEGFWIAAGTNGFVAIAKVKKNTNYTLTKDLGNKIRVVGFASEPVINGSHPADPTKYAQLAVGADELKTLSFNSGVFEYVACNLNSNTEYTGNMNAMVRLASIPDSTYEPYLTPNTDLMSYADNAVLGAKSLLNYTSIEINPNTDTGTVTDNGLSGISVNITKTSGHWTDIVFKCNIVLKAGVTYKLSCLGIPNNVKGIRLGDGISFVFSMDNGATSATYTPPTDITIKNWNTTIAIAEADTISFTYYPMLYYANDTDNTYQPPNVFTNYELSKEIVKKPNKEYQTWGTSHSFTIEKNTLSVLLTYGGGSGEISACIPINRGSGAIGYNSNLVPTGLTLSTDDGTLTVSSSSSFVAAMIFVM